VSETEFQRKLNHAWTCRSCDDPSDVRRFDDIERIGEADHVKYIEELRTELEVFAFGHRKVPNHRQLTVAHILQFERACECSDCGSESKRDDGSYEPACV
jgi:hypothetical protein